MFCSTCGNQLLGSDKFCDRCGQSQVNQRKETDQSQIEQSKTDQDQIDQSQDWSIREEHHKETSTEKSEEGKSENKNRWVIGFGVLFLMALLIVGGWVFLRPSPQLTFSDAMERGNHYLVELNFEQAEVYFRRAMEIDPRQVQPYVELAYIYYEHFEDVERALEVLERGMHEVPEEDIPRLIDVWGEMTTLPPPISLGEGDAFIPEPEPEEVESPEAEEEEEEILLIWMVLPTLEHDWIYYCECGQFSDINGIVIDPTTGLSTGEPRLGHGGWPPAWAYDLDRGLFGDPGFESGFHHLLGMHPYEQFMEIYLSQDRGGWQDTFDEWFEELMSRPMLIQRVDSSLRHYSEFHQDDGEPWWWLTEDAFLGEFAVMYRGNFITDFIFDGSTIYLSFIGSDGFYFATVSMEGRWGMIDENGEVLIPFIFDHMVPIDENRVFAKYNGVYGILDIRGTIEQNR